MALRWWLLNRVARSCGLQIGVTARLQSDGQVTPARFPVFVVFSRDLQSTLEAVEVLTQTFTKNRDITDPRLHTEWTH